MTKNMKILNLKEGERVTWTYNHWISGKRSETRTKVGTFLRYVNSKKKLIVTQQFVMVQFDGNKKPSKIEELQLSKSHAANSN